MTLFDIKVNPELLKSLVNVLERIADGIDRAYPPKPKDEARAKLRPHGPDDLIVFSPEAEAWREEEEEARQS